MLWKLSLTSIKSRFRDYAILFSGLTLATAIFYMFLTLALNPRFLQHALPIAAQTTSFVFMFGIVLLVLITFIYLIYANSFLLSMRQHDYGLYMMLGARNSRIGLLIFSETLLVGLLATIVGIIIGLFLTQLIASLLIKQLGLIIHHFVGFYWPAVGWTAVFFVLLFLLAALWNTVKLTKTKVLTLVHEEQKPVKLRMNRTWQVLEALLGLALLAAGYWAMAAYKTLVLNSIPLALFTIVLGSYFVFSSLFTMILSLLRKNKKFAYHGLRLFTLGQLQFRIKDYNRILTVVSLLFALALGAITVGLNFNHLTDESTKQQYYDAIVPAKTPSVKKELRRLSVQHEDSFTYKIHRHRLYVSAPEIDGQQLKAQVYHPNRNEFAEYRTVTLRAKEIEDSRSRQQIYFLGLLPAERGQLKLVNARQYQRVPTPKQHVYLFVFRNFKGNWQQIQHLQQTALRGQKGWQSYQLKTSNYQAALALASGFEFMGFFLGLAFLAMLASTLMFKVLSGASSDRPRYRMLTKIGAQASRLRASVAKEIGVLFTLPALLGMIDVLFGLQFFKSLLANPYDKIYLPFSLFLILYVLYYWLTVKLYISIVLKKKR